MHVSELADPPVTEVRRVGVVVGCGRGGGPQKPGRALNTTRRLCGTVWGTRTHVTRLPGLGLTVLRCRPGAWSGLTFGSSAQRQPSPDKWLVPAWCCVSGSVACRTASSARYCTQPAAALPHCVRSAFLCEPAVQASMAVAEPLPPSPGLLPPRRCRPRCRLGSWWTSWCSAATTAR